MKTKILIVTLCLLFVSGCGTIFVARSRPLTPGYCNDCHHNPHWRHAHNSCEHYEIIVVKGGYKYRPRHDHQKHQSFKFAKYDQSRDNDKHEKKSEKKGDKEKKSRR